MTKNEMNRALEFPVSDFARLFEAQIGETYLVQDHIFNEQGKNVAKPGDNVTLKEIDGDGPVGYQVQLATKAGDNTTVPFESSYLMGWYPGLPASIAVKDREALVEHMPSFAIFTKQGDFCAAVQSGTIGSAYGMTLELGMGGPVFHKNFDRFQAALRDGDLATQNEIIKGLYNNSTIVEISSDQLSAVLDWQREGSVGKFPIPTPPHLEPPKEHSAFRVPENQDSIQLARKNLKSMSDDTLLIQKFATIQKRNENSKNQQTPAIARERLELRNGLRLINQEMNARGLAVHIGNPGKREPKLRSNRSPRR